MERKASGFLLRHTPLVVVAILALSVCVAPLRARVGAAALGALQQADSTRRTQSLPSDSPRRTGDSLMSPSLGVPSNSPGDHLDSADSVSPAKDPAAGFDDIVEYKAKDSVVMLGTNMVYFFGPSTVDYKDKGIEGEYMRMNVDSNLVYAQYRLDSLGNPTAHPKFKDGGQSYEAKSMNYNFKTSKGFITGVVTQQGEGYVVAEKTKKSDDGCMYMEGGRYTTCDKPDHPHFHLQLTRAKVRPGKNIVAGPSYLVIAGVPLPIGLPFGFFPFSKSYSSGIIMPSYGEESTRGIYLREGGYYFAINDYIDLAATGDWYSRGSWGVNLRSNYRKRYRYNGALSGSYLVTVTGDKDVVGTYSKNTDFRISWTHSQDAKANPNQTFTASVNYSTSRYNHNSLNTLYNPGVSSQNTKSSSINYTKTFAGTPWSLSASIDATQTSSNEMVSLNSPNISLTMSRIFPFRRKNRVGAERWYEKISVSYSGQLRNSITAHEDEVFKKNLIKDWQNGMSHSIPISASYKILDYIDLTLSANYTERWYSYKSYKHYDGMTQQVVSEKKYGFNRVYDFSTTANVSTTIYGFFQPWKVFGGKLQMVRHRMTPTIGITYRPDFGTKRWGYYGEHSYTNPAGQLIREKYSYYEGQLFGTATAGKSAALTFSIDNNIEAKIRTKPHKDSTDVYKKVSLIDNFAISSSYNLAADSFRLADINMRLAFKLSKSVSLNLSGAFDPYVYSVYTDGSGVKHARREDKIRLLHGQGIGSLRGTGTSFSYTLNNETWKKIRKLFGYSDEGANSDDTKREENPDISGAKPSSQDGSMGEMARQQQERGGSIYGQQEDVEYDSDGYVKNTVPWSISLNYGINYTRQNFNVDKEAFDYRVSHSLMLNGSIQPTKNWNFNFSASYDFDAKKIANMTIGISRDLHCWTFTASVIPFGYYKSYNFSIGVKSSLLRDLKYDKHGYTAPNSWY